MARQHLPAHGRSNLCGPFHASARAAARGALLGLALLGAPLACGSDSDDGADDAAAEQNDPPADSEDEPRDGRPAAPNPQPSATDEEDEGDDAMPANPAVAEPEDAPDESPAAPGASAGNSGGVPPAAASAFASCTRRDGSYGTNCDYLYVTMTLPEGCVQLTVDNCGDGYSSQGLAVDTPLSWKVSSATIGSATDDCHLGLFSPDSIVVVDASGSISWDAALPNALPTGIVLDVTLQPSSSADDTSSIDVVTTEPLTPSRCEE